MSSFCFVLYFILLLNLFLSYYDCSKSNTVHILSQGVSRALVENSRTLRLPTYLHERLGLIRNAKNRLEEKGITPTIDVSGFHYCYRNNVISFTWFELHRIKFQWITISPTNHYFKINWDVKFLCLSFTLFKFFLFSQWAIINFFHSIIFSEDCRESERVSEES